MNSEVKVAINIKPEIMQIIHCIKNSMQEAYPADCSNIYILKKEKQLVCLNKKLLFVAPLEFENENDIGLEDNVVEINFSKKFLESCKPPNRFKFCNEDGSPFYCDAPQWAQPYMVQVFGRVAVLLSKGKHPDDGEGGSLLNIAVDKLPWLNMVNVTDYGHFFVKAANEKYGFIIDKLNFVESLGVTSVKSVVRGDVTARVTSLAWDITPTIEIFREEDVLELRIGSVGSVYSRYCNVEA